MAQSEEPDRKRARFSKVDGDFLAKLRVGPGGDQRSSSCRHVLETTWQGINIELKEVPGSNRERFQKVYTWRLAVRTAIRARSLQSQAEGSELLFRGTCMLQPSDSTRNIISGDDFVGSNQTIDPFLRHLAKEGEVQATHHKEKRFRRRTKRSCSPIFIREIHEPTSPDTNRLVLHDMPYFRLRSREVDRVT